MCLKSIGLDFPRVVIVQIVTACHAFHAIDSPTSGSRDSAADVVALVQDRDQDQFTIQAVDQVEQLEHAMQVI